MFWTGRHTINWDGHGLLLTSARIVDSRGRYPDELPTSNVFLRRAECLPCSKEQVARIRETRPSIIVHPRQSYIVLAIERCKHSLEELESEGRRWDVDRVLKA